MAPILGYWDIRGLAQPIRYLLEYVGQEYEDKRYKFGPNGDFSAWFDEKYSHGLDFPNLPYYIDGDLKITQSLAILRYLSRKHDLYGDSEEEKVRVDLAEQQMHDVLWGFFMVLVKPNYLELKPEYAKNFSKTLDLLSQFLGDGEWLAGKKLTYVDFLAYETLDYHRYFIPECLSKHKKIADYMKRFEKLPAIEKYLKSDRFKKYPFFGPKVYWGYKDGEPPVE